MALLRPNIFFQPTFTGTEYLTRISADACDVGMESTQTDGEVIDVVGLSSKGQIVIPLRVRRQLDLREGSKVLAILGKDG